MSRIDATFAALKGSKRRALIPFVTAGYPFADVTPELMHAMVAGGADVIELGVPFSDPSADGPVIQKAGDKALVFGIGLVQVLAMVSEFRKSNSTTPVVLMGYANPVERYDQKQARAGVASALGVLGSHVGDTRLIGGAPMAVWMRRVLSCSSQGARAAARSSLEVNTCRYAHSICKVRFSRSTDDLVQFTHSRKRKHKAHAVRSA